MWSKGSCLKKQHNGTNQAHQQDSRPVNWLVSGSTRPIPKMAAISSGVSKQKEHQGYKLSSALDG